MLAPAVLAFWTWHGWSALVAIGTIGLAAMTAWLAVTTRSLARAAVHDERAQWRPVLAVGPSAPVAYDDDTGLLSVEMRNVGRGPAFGVHAQLRGGRRALGASIPGADATVVAPGEEFQLQARISDPTTRIRGLAVSIDVNYYDITERWHTSHLTMTGRRPPDKINDASVVPTLAIATVFVNESDRQVLPVLGSPKALAAQAREQRRWRNQVIKSWSAVRSRLFGRR